MQRKTGKISINTKALFFAMTLSSLVPTICSAQDLPPPQGGTVGAGSPSAGAPNGALNVERGNPLEGLFTPQPQYLTPQALPNPQPAQPAAGELNPFKGLFTPPVQFHTPQAIINPEPQAQLGEENHLKGFFTPPNQWSTPQTPLNPTEQPKHFVPERQLLWGSDETRDRLIRQHNLNTFGTENPRFAAPPPVPNPNTMKPTPIAQQQAAPPKKEPPLTPEEKAERNQLREALSQIRSGKYTNALSPIDVVIQRDPKSAQAHYLRAVALVSLRRYNEAADEYRQVLRLTTEQSLIDLAEQGLKKLHK